jgi:hypothetical protein
MIWRKKMTNKSWANTSFWDSYQKDRITTVLTITDDDGNTTTQQLSVNKYGPDGSENTDFQEIIEQWGEESLSANTVQRNERKAAKRDEEEQRRIEKEKAKELQKLFEAKIQAFEVEQIKNSSNRILKSKLRKAQNIIEVNIYSMMIVMEELKNAESEAGTI